jgi:integrase/recombinase XerD
LLTFLRHVGPYVVTRLPTLSPRDSQEEDIIAAWRDHGLRSSTMEMYLRWVRRWRTHWGRRGIDGISLLTLAAVTKFLSRVVGSQARHPRNWANARKSIHAWAYGLRTLGVAVPQWRPAPRSRRLPAVLSAYAEYRCVHHGVAAITIHRGVEIAAAFLRAVRSRGRSIATVRVADIESVVDRWLTRVSRVTVADRCSSLRSFLRFLRATGRLRRDLATWVVSPRVRVAARPPRAMAWADVRRILRAVPHRRASELRDYAMLLLLASYGLGAAEAVRLRCDDLDWTAKVLRVRRPKTGVLVELPLLPQVARAITAYLRRGRPRGATAREVFLIARVPFGPLTSRGLQNRVRKYVALAGITPTVPIGSHLFRHSHATRQIDLGANPKVVSDILGHRRPSSTSAYVRVALRRLRALSLPVPR